MVERLNRREKVISLREGGLTYVEIGRKLGLSRERARQIAKGETTTKKKRLAMTPIPY